jgi:hypothetical protein
LAPLLAKHNMDFCRSYERWFQALYQDKYEYMGDYDLMQLAFRLDLGLYYLGVAAQPFKRGPVALLEPVFSTKPSSPFFHFIRFYNRRFVQIARCRRLDNRWGRNNNCRRRLIRGYTFGRTEIFQIAKALAGWFRLELAEGWKTWFRNLRCSSNAELVKEGTMLKSIVKEPPACEAHLAEAQTRL